jgi:hypothetical protein
MDDDPQDYIDEGDPDAPNLLAQRDELLAALEAARDHFELCGYGDKWAGCFKWLCFRLWVHWEFE